MTYRRMITILITGLLVTGSGFARGKKINRSELPPAVERTFQSETQGATVKRLSQEDRRGQIYYEAKMSVDGHSKDVLIDANGDVLRVKEQVAVGRLPADVKAGLKAKAGFLGRIAKVESITKKDKLVAYEAEVEKPVFFVPGVTVIKSKVQVDPDGN
jgi:hypothetical protein